MSLDSGLIKDHLFEPLETFCSEVPVEKESELSEELEVAKESNLTRSYSIGAQVQPDQDKFGCCAYMSNNKIIISVFRRLLNDIITNESCSLENIQLLQTKYNIIISQAVIDFLNWAVNVGIIIRLLKNDCSKAKLEELVRSMTSIYVTTELYTNSYYAGDNPFSNEEIIQICVFYLGLIIFIYYLTWTKYKSLKCLTLKTKKFVFESSSQYQLLLELFTLPDIDINSLMPEFIHCHGMKEDITKFLHLIKQCTPSNIFCCPFNITYYFDESYFVIIFWDYERNNTFKTFISVDDVLKIVSYCVSIQHTYVEFSTELDNFDLFTGTPNPTVHSVTIKEYDYTKDKAGIGNSWGRIHPYFYIPLGNTIINTIKRGIRDSKEQHLELNGVFIIDQNVGPPEIYNKIVSLSKLSSGEPERYATEKIINEELIQLQEIIRRRTQLQEREEKREKIIKEQTKKNQEKRKEKLPKKSNRKKGGSKRRKRKTIKKIKKRTKRKHSKRIN